MRVQYKDTLKFISTVKDRPALWDHSHHLNNDKLVNEAIWDEIATEFNMNGPSAKARWKGLRDHFRRELRKSPLGIYGNTINDYNSRWRYFSHMFFIKEQLRQVHIAMPYAIETTNSSTSSSTKDEEMSSMNIEKIDEEEVSIVETTPDAFVREFPKVYKAREDIDVQLAERVITHNEDNDLMESVIRTVNSDVGFLASFLPHLRSMPEKRKAFLKNDLMKVLVQYLDVEESSGVKHHCNLSSEDVHCSNKGTVIKSVSIKRKNSDEAGVSRKMVHIDEE